MLKISELKINGLTNPLGIDISSVVISWKTISNISHYQKAYQIIIKENNELVYDSKKVNSTCQTDVHVDSFSPKNKTQYQLELTIFDENDNKSDIYISFFETGLMEEKFQASWIEPKQIEAKEDESGLKYLAMLNSANKQKINKEEIQPAQYLKKSFYITKKVKKARCYASAHGIYSVYINDMKISQRLFAPEITSYKNRLFYQTYDITSFLVDGKNTIGIILADGWYVGRIGLIGENHQYGKRLAFIGQIEIEYDDGETIVIKSDASFKSTVGMIKYADMFLGECHDFNDSIKFESPFSDTSWTHVDEVDEDKSILIGQTREPIKVIEKIKPIKKIINSKNEIIYDFGKVISGIVEIKTRSEKNTMILVDYAEVLDTDDSYVFTVKGRHKNHQDKMILSGNEDHFLPEFTYHAFRYVRVSQDVDFIQACAIASDVKKSLSFETSCDKLNKIQDCISQTQLTNMVSVLTDNPSREKSAFTGDNQLYMATAFYNYDLSQFISDWLVDCRYDQCENGAIPDIIPFYPKMKQFQKNITGSSCFGRAGWGDGCIVIPYEHYRFYNQIDILKDNYTMMTKWMEYVESQIDDKFIWYGTQINDISHPHKQDGIIYNHARKKINKEDKIIDISTIFSTIHYGYSAKLLSYIANELKLDDDKNKYTNIYNNVKKTVLNYFIHNDMLVVDVQSSYVYLLGMEMIDDPYLKKKLVDRLCFLIENNNKCHDLGFFGLRFLIKILFENDKDDLAFDILLNNQSPSWMYMINHNATTLWEHWENIDKDGHILNESFTQCGAGCIGESIYQHILGLNILKNGFKEFSITPKLNHFINTIKFTFESVYGKIYFFCKEYDEYISFEIEVPFNTTAHVFINKQEYNFKSGTHHKKVLKIN